MSIALVYPTLSVSADWQAVDIAAQVGVRISTKTEGYLCVADMDGDGLSDIVLSRHGQEKWPLMRQRPDGTFVQIYAFSPKNDRHSCAVGDFAGVNANGSYGPPDGRPDIYTVTGACMGTCTKEFPNNLHIQRPDGTFQDAAAAFGVTDPHGRGRQAVAIDANSDGRDDIYFTNEGSTTYPSLTNRLFLNTGPGFVEFVDPDVNRKSSICARALDFNDDGRPDLVLCTDDTTYFLANSGAGFSDVRADLGLPASPALRDVAMADFNGDGHADLVALEGKKLAVRLWRATGTPFGSISFTLNLSQGRAIAIGNLLGTGHQRDIYVVDGWVSNSTLQSPDWILHWNGANANPMFQAWQVPAPATVNADNPRNGQGDAVGLIPNWGGTGRDLAVVSNGLYLVPGYYQAIFMSSDGGVPNVVGLTQSAAASALADAGLVLGTVTQQSSETVPVGKVISQNPAAGASAPDGSAVNLLVSSGPATVTVPDVVGMTQSAATTSIIGTGLVIGTVTDQSSTTAPAGRVISQNPLANTSVAQHSAVNLVVSSGPPVDVPDVVGLEQTAASTALIQAGLSVGAVIQQPSSTVQSGNVISQSPVAGTSVEDGSSVNLTVSTGPTPVSVPNVVGIAQTAAETALTNAELIVGAVTEEFSPTVQSGRVIHQSPASGTTVAPGSPVNLVVSKGPKPVSVPNVVGLAQGAASAALTNAELAVGSITKQASDTAPPGEVLSQDPTADATVDAGSAVDLVVAKAPLVSVPDVVGMAESDATAALANAGLGAGAVTLQLSQSVPAGSVISQDPGAGTMVDSGTTVDLMVSKGAPVAVPDVVGIAQSAAEAAIVDAALVVGSITPQSSATQSAGNVISQSPPAGTNVASGSAVNLIVSTGPAPVNVPNVVGLAEAAAGGALSNAGLVVGTVTQQSSATVPAGNVISQSPSGGTSVANGSAVDLVVSTGPVMIVVPDVVGFAQSAASAALANAGLVAGTVTQQSSTTVPVGSVISESPAAGTSVAEGSAVNLVVSSGAAAASVSVNPGSLAFGNQSVNVASTGVSVTIANTGATVVPVTSITLTGSNPGQFSRSTNCPSQLAVGGSCTATVVFKPTSTGNKTASLSIALGGGLGTRTVTLTGTGVNLSFTVSPTSLSFGSVARGVTSTAKTVTVKNTSTTALTISSVALGGNAPSQYTRTNNCPSQLSAGATCTVQVKFKPTSTGSKSATLVVTPAGATAKSVTLSGTGT